uniref:Uncharacterized protein n=1 Tax=Romanomermis culicivorax TaxID=13658 RepID=A0A915I3R4_ROMCU
MKHALQELSSGCSEFSSRSHQFIKIKEKLKFSTSMFNLQSSYSLQVLPLASRGIFFLEPITILDSDQIWEAYCPLYMGDCTGVRVVNTDSREPDYGTAILDHKLSKFDAMCPNFNEYCASSDKKIQHAIRYLNLCYSLASYGRVANCSAKYTKPEQLRKLEGCKKCHKYCQQFIH